MKIRTLLRTFSFLILLLGMTQVLSARKLLKDFDMSEGKWELIGVSLHNYKPIPLQDRLGTFVLRDQYIIKQIQEEWDFEEKFDDYCDYHYALKLYKNGELQTTLRANLHCNYISLGGLSYEFEESDLVKYQRYFRPMKWSRIRFKDPDLLKVAVHELDDIRNVYWYGDVKQYDFDGFFMTGVDSLPWNANRDSVADAITTELANKMDRDDFYLQVSHWYMTNDFNYMHLRFKIYASEAFFKAYPRKDVLARWRSQYSSQSFIQIMVIGLDKKGYYEAMKEHL